MNNRRKKQDRRIKPSKIQTNNRRSKALRRKEDITDNTVYFSTVLILLVSIISWVSYSVYLYIQEVAK